jgi:hypothetical protein
VLPWDGRPADEVHSAEGVAAGESERDGENSSSPGETGPDERIFDAGGGGDLDRRAAV